jgi:hypothetical protein
MNTQARKGFLHACVLAIAIFAFLGQAVAQSLTIYESEQDFFANAETVSTENFDTIPTDTYIAEAAVVIDEVTYDTLIGGDPTDPPWCVAFGTYCWRIYSPLWDRPPVTLPNLLQSRSADPFDWGDSQVIWFGEDKFATAIGFYFVLPGLIPSPDPECPLSGWEIIVYEANGTVTTVSVPPEIAANPATAYRGFASSIGITKLELAPEYLDLDCFQTMGWGYDNVSRSAIHDIELHVDLDIKPDSLTNAINPRNRGRFWVAIVSASDFDALEIDPQTVQFGTGMASPDRLLAEDVDEDGVSDLMLRFRTQEVGIACGDTTVELSAKTYAGRPAVGLDSIRTVGCETRKTKKK